MIKEQIITKIETSITGQLMSGLLLVRIHTDQGIIGHGESYYTPHAVASMIHDWMGRRLLGANALDITSHWRFLYERCVNFGGRGVEMRALSAIDLALWDIFGQAMGVPVWQLLGGKSQQSVAVYNSCGGTSYSINATANAEDTNKVADQGWPGYGRVGGPGPLEDYYNVINNTEDFAKEMVDLGYTGIKTWLFDKEAHKPGGKLRIDKRALKKCVEPLSRIRKSVGDKLEIMVDGHGFFELPAALRIAEALEDFGILWAEDLIRMDNISTLEHFREKSNIPIAVSEMYTTSQEYRDVLTRNIADYIEIDPTWVGGITESMHIAQFAQAYNIPVTFHDSTGPLTVLAGVQMAVALPNVIYQETVRAHINSIYGSIIDEIPIIKDGAIEAPSRPGIGAAFHPIYFVKGTYNYRASTA